jgi:transcriptional regulator GlxA family with amidase domain
LSEQGLPVRWRVGLVAYDRVNGFDIAGPLEVFATATAMDPARPAYGVDIVAATLDPVTTEAGMWILPAHSFADAGDYDTIIVPGGAGLRESGIDATIAQWLVPRLATTRRIASVCTGIYGLAATGVLDGRRATTHWRFIADAQRRFPAILMQSDCIYVEDGPCFTSGGVCAGIDLALAMVRADLGPSAALATGHEMVVPSLRAGAQAQFSEPLRAQARAPRRLADLIAWIGANLDADLSLPVLAARAAIGERQLSRMFRDGLGESPGALVARLRLQAAHDMLSVSPVPVGEVARLTGYRSPDAFGRAYARTHGEPPEMTRDHQRMSETAG